MRISIGGGRVGGGGVKRILITEITKQAQRNITAFIHFSPYIPKILGEKHL
jgi:hypothetical protein